MFFFERGVNILMLEGGGTVPFKNINTILAWFHSRFLNHLNAKLPIINLSSLNSKNILLPNRRCMNTRSITRDNVEHKCYISFIIKQNQKHF